MQCLVEPNVIPHVERLSGPYTEATHKPRKLTYEPHHQLLPFLDFTVQLHGY